MEKNDGWSRLLLSGYTTDTGCAKFPFAVMTKKFGKNYLDYLSASWAAWGKEDGLPEFLEIHGGIPESLFQKKVLPDSAKMSAKEYK